MFNGMDMGQLLEKAKAMQEEMKNKQDEASDKTVEVQVGGGMVKVAMNGKLEVLKVEIDKEVIDRENKDTLEDLIRAGMNEAIRQAQELSGGGMADMLKNLQMPDLSGFKFPGK